MLKAMKALIVAVWALIIANLVLPFPEALVFPLQILGGLLVVAHIIELFVFKHEIKAKGDSRIKSTLMTLVFGAFYFKAK